MPQMMFAGEDSNGGFIGADERGMISFPRGVGLPRIYSGQSSNADLTGRITLSGGTAIYNLQGAYVNPPNCLTQDVTTPTSNSYAVETNTAITFHGSGSDVIKWICAGTN